MAKNQNSEQNGVLFRGDVPKMPEGYYPGDKPNVNLRAFVEEHLEERPYKPEADDYDVAPFDSPIQTSKNSAVYSMHGYHLGKKPHDAIEQYVQHFTEPGDLIVDPFCGSGSTALAALLCGRKAIAIDLSPAATFISRFYVAACDTQDLQVRFNRMMDQVREDMRFLYSTRCHRCGADATIHYVIYSNVYKCPRCLSSVSLFEASQQTTPCCPICLRERGVAERIGSGMPVVGYKPVAVNFSCHGSCTPKRTQRSVVGNPEDRRAFEDIDLQRISEIEGQAIPYPYPTQFMMNVEGTDVRWGDQWRPSYHVSKVTDLFTYRNLWALAALFHAAGSDDDLRAVITSGMLAVSRKAQHLDEGGGYIPGNWGLPPMSKQRNVPESLSKVFKKTLEAKQTIAAGLRSTQVCISTQSATDLSAIPASSVDYIFTDPPYGGAVQYAELNFLWETWLGLDTSWHGQEIIVNQTRGKTEDEWAASMRETISECYRVLRPGRWISLCYHDTSTGTWELIQDIMAEAGFVIGGQDRALSIDTGGSTYNQRVADKVIKRDLVVNYRKPKPGETLHSGLFTGDEDETTFFDKAKGIIRDFLLSHPGTTKDRVYDELVSRMVSTGQMESHDFDALLSQVAEPSDVEGSTNGKRWYLKDAEGAIDAAESAKEDAAAGKIRDFISEWLDENPGTEGVHYSDIFQHYVYTVRDKPRRSLADWLLDYFYKTDSGTYRLPVSEEEERIKAEARASGTSRRIKHYIAHLQQGTPVMDRDRPSDATLAEWIRHCKRSGLYEQGKLLYERGGLNLNNLSEEAMVNVEEDYQVCARMLARNGGNEKKTRKRGG